MTSIPATLRELYAFADAIDKELFMERPLGLISELNQLDIRMMDGKLIL